MKTLNYKIHLLISNKYYSIYKILFLLLIYLTIYNKDIVLCMNENTNIVETPPVAEAKESVRPSHQVIALKKEITDYAGSQVELLEKIERRDIKIHKLKEKIERLERQVLMWQNEVGELRLQYEERDARLCGYNSDDTYKEPDYHEDPSYYYDNDYYQT